MGYVFISYSRADLTHARNLYHKLIRRGFQVWFDEESLLPGQIWEVEIEEAIHSASLVLVLLSTHSVSRTGYAQKEIRTAISVMERMPESKPYLVPLRIDNCTIPGQLSHIHCGMLTDKEGLERLIKTLYEYTGAPTTEGALPANYRRFESRFHTDQLLIIPGYGAAGIRVGASPFEVQSHLGKPSNNSYFENCHYICYYDNGLSFLIEKDIVKTIFAYHDGADGYSGFPGKTPEGVSTNSTRREIEAVFGRPSSVGGNGIINYWIQYGSFGIGFTYDTLDAVVHHLTISR